MIQPFRQIVSKLKTSNIGQRMLVGASWSVFGTAAAKAMVLAAGIICANILTKQQYGEVGIIRSTLNLFITIGLGGLGLTATKYIAEYKSNAKERINSIHILANGFSLILGLVLGCLIYAFSTQIACNTLHNENLIDGIKVGAILLLFAILTGAQVGSLSGFEDFKSIAINTFWGSLAESVGLICGAYFYGVSGAVLGYGLGFIVQYILNCFSIRSNFRKNHITLDIRNFAPQDLRLLYKYSIPAALSSFTAVAAYWYAKTLLATHAGFEAVGAFEAADQWRIIILFIPTAVGNIVLPILSSLSADNQSSYNKVFNINLLVNVVIASLIAIAVAVLSPYIMQLYGKAYTADYTTLVILALSTMFSTAASVVGSAISSKAKVWHGFGFNLLWAVNLCIITYFLLCRGYSDRSLAWGILLSYIIHTFLQLIYVHFLLKPDR